MSILSPKLYGNGGPFDMAEATADFRNSISIPSQVTVMLSSLVLRVCALIITHDFTSTV